MCGGEEDSGQMSAISGQQVKNPAVSYGALEV